MEKEQKYLLLDYKKIMVSCNLSKRKAYELLHDPQMPVVRIGKRRFMNAVRFQHWIDQHTQGPAS